MLRGNDREWTKYPIPGRVGISFPVRIVAGILFTFSHLDIRKPASPFDVRASLVLLPTHLYL